MDKKFLFSFFFSAVAISTLSGQPGPSWLRYPAISPDSKTIVFTFKGDLYKVSSEGGTAIPLTQSIAHDFMPVWSHDGKTIAFASNRHGNFDIYTVSSSGGAAKRLTFHSQDEYPYSFSPDDKYIFFGSTRLDAASNRQFPAEYMPELYQVPTTGGRVLQTLTTPAEDVNWSKDGRYMLYHDRKGGENAWRKHHVSSAARDIWLYDANNHTHTRLTDFQGEDRNPVFDDKGENMYYLSEASGSFNIYSMNIKDKIPRQVTFFTKFPVRFLTGSLDGTLSFSYDGEIYLLKKNGKPQKLDISILSTDKTETESSIDIAPANTTDWDISPNGKEIAFVSRGEVFVSSIEYGTVKRITHTPERERYVNFSPDGRTLIYASERGEKWKIFQTSISRKEEPYFFSSTILKEELLVDNQEDNFMPKFSPTGKEVAYVANRTKLKIYNLITKKTTTILDDGGLFSISDNDKYFSWSPDGRWLLFEFTEPGVANKEIGIKSSDGKGKRINLTKSGFQDFLPKWSTDGKLMTWLGTKEGLRAQAASGETQADVYALFFTQEALDLFKLSKEDFSLLPDTSAKEKNKEVSSAKTLKDTVLIAWEGLEYRKVRLTTNSSEISDALVSKNCDSLYYLTRFEKGTNLWLLDLRTKESKILKTLEAGFNRIVWDKEFKHLILFSEGKILRIDPVENKQLTTDLSGKFQIDLAAERADMFYHVWRRTQQIFYKTGYHGNDWNEIKKDYEKYLPFIGNNYELAEMLSEMLGELNVSHSGARYSPPDVPANDSTASLGIFYDQTYKGTGVKIDEILIGGPLDKQNQVIKPGMILESIDGETIGQDKNLEQFLNHKAGKFTLLTVANPATKSKFEIKIKPINLDDEWILVYKRWVRRNAREVDSLTNGQVGYIHVPDMDDPSFRTVYEEAIGKYASRKALVVDTRNNGGGDLVADLTTFLTGKKFLDYGTDNLSIGFEPSFRWTKPSIALANEANYSDGHCFAFSYLYLGIGKLVGMPVAGTCTWAGSEKLQDNTISWGVPPLGVKNTNGQYLENHPTEPDIRVRNDYDKVSIGEDQQLEAAAREILKSINLKKQL